MGANTNLTKKSTSNYVVSDENLIRMQKKVIKLSEVPSEKIKQYMMCVGKDPEGNRINIFTVIFDYQSL